MRTGLSVPEAQRAVLEEASPLPPETLPAALAEQRVLAEAVVATRTLPPSDVSAMDGYALRAESLRGATRAAPVTLPVAYEVAAGGGAPRPLGPGEAARIFTGAPLPPGADAVVRQEDTERDGDRVSIRVAVPAGNDVRRAGEDVRAGEIVLEPGTPLGPAALGMLAALGRSVVSVHQRPRVAILSGGDELVEPDRSVEGGRIVSSNSYALAAQCREIGAEPVYLGIARDAPEDLERRLQAGLACHALVSSGGVSVGDRDYVRPVLERLGCRLRFWGVRMKPGYPMAFGRFGEAGTLVFGLPGNPVSAMVTFELFVRPALLRLLGHRVCGRPEIRAHLTHTLEKKPGREHYVRVTLRREGGRLLASSTGTQSSGVLRSMLQAHGLLVFPAEAEKLEAGAEARVLLLDASALAPPVPGG